MARKTTLREGCEALRQGRARLVLVHGSDEAAIEEAARSLAGAMPPDAERVELSGAQIQADPGQLLGEAAALSLFGAPRWIRLSLARDEGVEAFQQLLAAPALAAPVIAVAGRLTPASKIKALAESHPRALAIACHAASADDLLRELLSTARSEGLGIDRQLAARLLDAVGGDIRLARGELVKLALMLDATPETPGELRPEHLAHVAGSAGEEDVSSLVGHLLSGAVAPLAADLARLRTLGVNEIRILKAIERRVTLLAGLAARLAGGEPMGSVVAKVFFREQRAVEQELRLWSPARLRGLTARLIRAQEALMLGGRGLGFTWLEQELIQLARTARTGGRSGAGAH